MMNTVKQWFEAYQDNPDRLISNRNIMLTHIQKGCENIEAPNIYSALDYLDDKMTVTEIKQIIVLGNSRFSPNSFDYKKYNGI